MPYPLSWPQGRKRATSRRSGQFVRSEVDAVREIHRQLTLMKAGEAMISSDKARFTDSANPQSGADPGVAVYFTYKSQERVVAIDLYYTTQHNLCAAANTLEALRTIERHGGVDVFEQALQGFDVAALPARKRPWPEVLRCYPDAPLSVIEAAYRAEAKVKHPDAPTGSKEAFQELQQALEDAKQERENG